MSKRIAVVGLGDIAQKAYLPVLAAHRDIDLVGIMGRHADKVQSIGEQYRISGRFTDLDRLLDERPELVLLEAVRDQVAVGGRELIQQAYLGAVDHCIRVGGWDGVAGDSDHGDFTAESFDQHR